MRKKEFSKRVHQLGAMSRRAMAEAEDGRIEEAACLLQESMPTVVSLYNELKPYIDAMKAYNEALEGSVKPLVVESEE